MGLFPFHLFQWTNLFSNYFAGFDLGFFRNADLNRLISEQKEHLLKCAFKGFFLVTAFLFEVFQGSCFYLKARLPASSDDDNAFLQAMRKQRLLSRLCAACR